MKWRREGDNLWRAEGAEAATEAASAAFSALESDPSDAFDVVGDADAAAFLDQQRARVASTRAEIEEMKRFSDMRRAVKLNRRRRSKLKKLETRVERAERRVGEYVAAGWEEFTRVVDILVEEGALDDVVDEDALRAIDAEAEAEARGGRETSNAAASADPIAGLLDWEPDDPSRPFSLEALDDARYLDDERERNGSYASDESRRVDPYAAERRARDLRRAARWRDGDDRMDAVLALTPLGETCAALRGENELWLGVALASDALEGLGPEQIAGVAGALCCDANRQTSCAYGPSPELDVALEAIEPDAGELMSLQFEAGMDAPVNVSRSVAALVESWASGASWDQVRRDTNLDEGDVARVFRRTAELLAQVPRARHLPEKTRHAAKRAANLVL